VTDPREVEAAVIQVGRRLQRRRLDRRRLRMPEPPHDPLEAERNRVAVERYDQADDSRELVGAESDGGAEDDHESPREHQ
jgi:hypothetical protein